MTGEDEELLDIIIAGLKELAGAGLQSWSRPASKGRAWGGGSGC
jgi:hypothetical protein